MPHRNRRPERAKSQSSPLVTQYQPVRKTKGQEYQAEPAEHRGYDFRRFREIAESQAAIESAKSRLGRVVDGCVVLAYNGNGILYLAWVERG